MGAEKKDNISVDFKEKLNTLEERYLGDQDQQQEIIELKRKLILLENEDQKMDTHKNMTWVTIFGMILYPFFITLADWLQLDTAAQLMSSIAPTYFVSGTVIVIIYFGAVSVAEKFLDMKSKKS